MVWDMLPSPLIPRSCISQQALRDLTAIMGPPESAGDGAILLRNLRIMGQDIPDMAVRESSSPTRLHVDGLLGFDFFQQFSEIIWQPIEQQVTLVLP
jgi:hypothetical protein